MTPEQMHQATKTHRIYLQDTDGNLYPSQFRAMYTPEGAGRICGTMNAGYPWPDGLKYVHSAPQVNPEVTAAIMGGMEE